MTETFSTMLPLGTIAPDFKLLDIRSGEQVSLYDVQSSVATIIIFMCNHCPYVKHILPKLIEVVKIYQLKGISFTAISSNDVTRYPEDNPEAMKLAIKKYDFTFPYLYDETQAVARAYQAVCTPDFFVFDDKLACVYRGRFDDSTPGNGHPVTGRDLRQALDALLTGKPISAEQKPSLGCNIKWKEN